jgi:hypothetical protein
MKVYSTTTLNPLKRPRCSIMPPPAWRSCVEDENDSEDDDEDDDSVYSLVLSERTDSDDEDSENEEEYYPHSKIRFAPTSSSAKASHYRPPKSECWWNRQDRQAFVSDCHNILDHDVPPAVAAHYKHVWDQAHQAPPPMQDGSSDYLEKVTLCLPTRLRGLEWGLQSKHAHRQTHVAKVLELQAKTKSLNPQFRERLLSNISQKSSRPSRMMASLLGEGDAKSLQEETADKSTTAVESSNPPTQRRYHRVACTILPTTSKKRKMMTTTE